MSIPMEVYTNTGGGRLLNSCNSTDSPIDVEGGSWPSLDYAGSQFMILVDGELMRVSSFTGTGTPPAAPVSPWKFYVSRGQEGTTNVTHNKGTLVQNILTVDSIKNLQTVSQFGLPQSTRRTINIVHDLAKVVDNVAADRCDITLTVETDVTNVAPIPPPQDGWVVVGSASYSADGSTVSIQGSTDSVVQAIFQPFDPTVPIIAGFIFDWKPSPTGQMGMACMNSTTGQIQVMAYGVSGGQWLADVYSDPTLAKIDNYEEAVTGPWTMLYLKCDGGLWSYSFDGYNFVIFSRIDNTPDLVGFFCKTAGSTCRLIFWEPAL